VTFRASGYRNRHAGEANDLDQKLGIVLWCLPTPASLNINVLHHVFRIVPVAQVIEGEANQFILCDLDQTVKFHRNPPVPSWARVY